jgi:hypothetical protein
LRIVDGGTFGAQLVQSLLAEGSGEEPVRVPANLADERAVSRGASYGQRRQPESVRGCSQLSTR